MVWVKKNGRSQAQSQAKTAYNKNTSMVSFDCIRSDQSLGHDRLIVNKTGRRQSSFKRPNSSTNIKTRKAVQFQSCESSAANVACTVHLFEKEDQRLTDQSIWSSPFWTHEELSKCYEDGIKEIAGLRSSYGKALHTAYRRAAVLNPSDCFINFQEYSMARGLEMIAFPAARCITKRHRRAVLSCQEWMRQKHDRWNSSSSDGIEEALQIASQRYSRASCCLALKLAKSDSM